MPPDCPPPHFAQRRGNRRLRLIKFLEGRREHEKSRICLFPAKDNRLTSYVTKDEAADLGHVVHGVLDAFAAEAGVFDAAVGEVVHAPGGHFVDEDTVWLIPEFRLIFELPSALREQSMLGRDPEKSKSSS
jgi:hypothetical protein